MLKTGRRILAFTLLGALAALPVVHAQKAGGGGAGVAKRTTPARPSAPLPVSLRGPVLPDTVLARVVLAPGPGGTVDVTSAQYVRALKKLKVSPDSLTPTDARRFLNMLVDQRILSARVAREPRQWTRRDSGEYVALLDRMTLAAALDSAMVATVKRMGPRRDSLAGMTSQQLGMLTRDSAVAAIHPKFDPKVLKFVADAFDTLPVAGPHTAPLEQMRLAGLLPNFTPADTGRVLVTSSAGTYTIGALMAELKLISPMYRPHIAGIANVMEATNNMLFESMLRQASAEQRLAHRPDIAAALAEKGVGLDVQEFVAREVYARITLDSATVRRHFLADVGKYDIGARASIVRMTFESKFEAGALARRLAIPGQAETLLAAGSRAGVAYGTTLSQDADRALFQRVARAGVGAILGPDSTAQGWRTLKIMSITPGRHRTFAEAFPLARDDWYDVEGERIMRTMLDDLRKPVRVYVNEREFQPDTRRPGRR